MRQKFQGGSVPVLEMLLCYYKHLRCYHTDKRHSLVVWFILVEMINTGIWQAIQGKVQYIQYFLVTDLGLLIESEQSSWGRQTWSVYLCTWGKSTGFITCTESIFPAAHSCRTPRGDITHHLVLFSMRIWEVLGDYQQLWSLKFREEPITVSTLLIFIIHKSPALFNVNEMCCCILSAVPGLPLAWHD